jgi:hypothetical protein
VLGDDLEHFDKSGNAHALLDWSPCVGIKYWHNRFALNDYDRKVIAGNGYPAPEPIDPLPGVPHWDVDANCHRPNSGTPISQQSVNWCVNTEQEAYNTLKLIWSSVRPGRDRDWYINASGQNDRVPYASLVHCAYTVIDKQRTSDTLSDSRPFQR